MVDGEAAEAVDSVDRGDVTTAKRKATFPGIALKASWLPSVFADELAPFYDYFCHESLSDHCLTLHSLMYRSN